MVGGSDCRMLVYLMMPCFFRTRGIHNRVGGTGLIPVPTSHTTVRAVRHTAVP